MAKANAQGVFGIIRSLRFEDGAKSEAPFAWFNTLEVAERVLSERIDTIGLFEDFRIEGRPLSSIEFYVADADGRRIESARRSFWDAELDAHLFEVLSDIRLGDEAVESAVEFSGNDYSEAVAALDSLDLEAAFMAHGGYGSGVSANAVLLDSSPKAFGGDAAHDLSRRFDDAVYESKLAAIGQAVHDGVLQRDEIRDLYTASDAEIDFAEGVFERPAGKLATSLSEAAGEDAPVKRNAEARELSQSQGSNAKRDATVRR